MQKSSTTSIKSKILAEKLKSYSLLAGTMLAGTIAKGQVLYTDIVPDTTLGSSQPGQYDYSLDLNNDGTFDFHFVVNLYGTFSGNYSFNEQIVADNPGNLVVPYTINYAPFMFKFSCDDSIPFPFYQYGFPFAFFGLANTNSNMVIWNDEVDKNIGLKFFENGNAHWAWVRVDVNTQGTWPNITIKDFAYELTPNKRIAACDTGSALIAELPELSGSMSMFPNPSTGISTIQFDKPIAGNIEMIVKDALGKEVYVSTFKLISQQTELPIDLTSLSPGIYFIQLTSGDISYAQKLIMK